MIAITQTGPGTNSAGLGRSFAPKSVLERIPAIYSTEPSEFNDKVLAAKWFCPYSTMRWYAVELDAETGQCFGYVEAAGGSEWGYFWLQEMADARVERFGYELPAIERDVHFEPITFCQLKGAVAA